MKPNQEAARIDHLNMSVHNYEESVAWYDKVFGFKPVEESIYEGEPWGVLRTGDTMLCIYQSPKKIRVDRHSAEDRFLRVDHFGLRLSDKNQWKDKLRKLNLETFYESPVQYPHSVSWYVKDPSGQMIEVSFWNDDTVNF